MRLLSALPLLTAGASALYIRHDAIKVIKTRDLNYTAQACASTLSPGFEFPHLIIPVDSSKPDAAPGTSFDGRVTDTISTIFNFDIPQSDANRTCSLVFLMPSEEQKPIPSYTFYGDGKVRFTALKGSATSSTSFNNAPKLETDLGVVALQRGHAYNIASFMCPAGQQISFRMSNAGNTNLVYFQDFGNPAFGLYITKC